VQQAAIVENACHQKQSRPCEDTENLRPGLAVKREQDGQDGATVDRDSAQKRHRDFVDLAMVWLVHDPELQGKPAHGHSYNKGGSQCDRKCDQSGKHGGSPDDEVQQAVNI